MYNYGLLIKARHDDMLRSADRYRLAAHARRARTKRPHHATPAPQRQPGMRPYTFISRAASLLVRKAQS